MVIRVQIEVFCNFKMEVPEKFQRGKNIAIFDEEVTIRKMLERLNIPRNVGKIVLVNGKYCRSDYLLKDGDFVKILPLLPGG